MRALLAHLADIEQARTIAHLLEEKIASGEWPLSDTVFYAYWCKHLALGLAWLKHRHPQAVAVARAHRNDVYLEKAPNRHITRQATIVDKLDGIFCISAHGLEYLRARYPTAHEKIHLARLGTDDSGIQAKGSKDGIIRVVTCSSASPVKRLDLALAALRRLSEIEGVGVEWTHFGSGPLLAGLELQAKQVTSELFKARFTGQKSLEEIFSHYASEPVDVFLNTSSSEGIPVSIMEAMSCGIPCAAPCVGGVPEIVHGNSGCVAYDPSVTPSGLAKILANLAMRRRNEPDLGSQVKAAWREKFHADCNYRAFADTLSSLTMSSQ